MALSIDLTNNEKRVLQILVRKDNFSPEELAATSGLSIEAAMQSAFLLAEKGFCEIKETLTDIFTLTKEGEEYAQKGLPERQVINSITATISISEFKKKFPPQMAGIALGWLRRKNWARIEGEMLIPGRCSRDGGR